MKVKLWNIDWDISDEDYIKNLGGLTDDNGLPYTFKDLSLPAWDKVIQIEIESEEGVTFREAVNKVLEAEYSFSALEWSFATEDEPGFRFFGLEVKPKT